MATWEQHCFRHLGLQSQVLMESAGRGVVEAIEQRYGGTSARGALVCCGTGNNGGDGFVVARYLAERGLAVRVVLLGEAGRLTPDAALNAGICVKLGLLTQEVHSPEALQAVLGECRAAWGERFLVIDALIGTGLSRPLTGFLAAAVEALNACGGVRVAVDIPSGLSADSAVPQGPHLRVELTVTFGAPKVGNTLLPAAESCGALAMVDIGLPSPDRQLPALPTSCYPRVTRLVTPHAVAAALPARRPEHYKNSYGHLLVIAGSRGMSGAAVLTCLGAHAVGTGLVTLGSAASLLPVLASHLVESMTLPLPEEADGTLARTALGPILSQAATCSAVALGPGLRLTEQTRLLVRDLLLQLDKPLLLDADALNALAAEPDLPGLFAERWQRCSSERSPVVLTPHPGEMARLTGSTSREVQGDRLAAVRKLAGQLSAHVILKGIQTLSCSPLGEVAVNTSGGPHMASGGMGDVLAGVLAGLLAQGVPAHAACSAGVYLHGLAADRLAATRHTVLASEVAAELPAALHELPGSTALPTVGFLTRVREG